MTATMTAGWILLFTAGAVPAAAQPTQELEPALHTYRTVNGTALKAYVFDAGRKDQAATRPAILLLHGGGWSVGSPDWTFPSARRYADMGMVAVSVQYRLSGETDTPIDALEDVCRAFAWVRGRAAEWGIDPRRVAASGVSAGGHLAAASATIGCGNSGGAHGIGGPDALVLWSPALDVARDGHFVRLLRGRAAASAYSPLEQVRADMPPVHIVQGEEDVLTPARAARRFCERVTARGGRCEITAYPGVGHLLTRNLRNQESDFDPDPAMRDDGNARQRAFLAALWPR